MGSLIFLGGLDDALQFLRALRPREGRAVLIVVGNKLNEKVFEFAPRAMHAVRQPLLTENAKEAFDEIHPGGMRRGVVEVDAGMAPEPAPGGRVFVNVEVVQDHVQIACGEGSDDVVQETKEVDRGATLLDVSQNLARGNFQGRQQGLRAVTDIFAGPTARLLGSQGQEGLGTVQGLNPRLFIDAQDQGVFRGIQVQTRDVQQFGLEVRVGAESEGAKAMRL